MTTNAGECEMDCEISFAETSIDPRLPAIRSKVRNHLLEWQRNLPDGGEGVLTLAGVAHFVTFVVRGDTIEANVMPRDDAERELNKVGLSTHEPWSPLAGRRDTRWGRPTLTAKSNATEHGGAELLRKRGLRDLAWEAVNSAIELDAGDASEIIASFINELIEVLRADPVMPRRTTFEWELFFADVARDAERDLAALIDGYVDRNDVVDCVADALEEETEAL